ncbi:flagellar FlbD family protein [Microbacterium candidum]|uniref:Flagellar FlbD family protein n=1 Tax=Microbacterium candidum TaxID=3041922 RepID=A0ABT7MTV4_9MICO|nr:flagellar FlbD family protein [Microbacterium sp. ASV49]MDL9977869.1 flagellar FlbD family protein [Microbacterium sp. ASV49]
MITVTRLDQTRFAVNPDLIERAYASPDTTLHMVDGGVFVVKESLDELTGLIVAYRARVLAAASGLTAQPEG